MLQMIGWQGWQGRASCSRARSLLPQCRASCPHFTPTPCEQQAAQEHAHTHVHTHPHARTHTHTHAHTHTRTCTHAGAPTIAAMPGTTLGLINVPGLPLGPKHRAFDTPGVPHQHQLTAYLRREDVKLVRHPCPCCPACCCSLRLPSFSSCTHQHQLPACLCQEDVMLVRQTGKLANW